MRITQRFTFTGFVGVLFLFAGPAMIAYFFNSVIESISIQALTNPLMPTGAGSSLDYLMMLAGWFISLCSFPMIIIGREFEGETGLSGLGDGHAQDEPTF